MEPLKNMFGRAYYQQLARALTQEKKNFDEKAFIQRCMKPIRTMELNQRLRHTVDELEKELPDSFLKALPVLKRLIQHMPHGYTSLVFPEYVAKNGLSFPHQSMEALRFFTSFGSSEFAVRHFLRQDFQGTIGYLNQWATDPDHHVRRLASEGCRPRLPWSFQLTEVIQNPNLTRSILDTLREDPSVYVRKSVANHINDISKDHPEYIVHLVKNWQSDKSSTQWIIRHGTRTLIKNGHQELLKALGYQACEKVVVEEFRIGTKKVLLGESLEFVLTLHSHERRTQKIIVDYMLTYQRADNKSSSKVFKWRVLELEPGERQTLEKKQRIKDFSTRKHYPGKHKVSIQINGIEQTSAYFDLLIPSSERG